MVGSSLTAALLASASSGDGDSGQRTYTGKVLGDWAVGAIPHGGYVLGIVLSAAIASQAQTSHPDVIHVSAHFLRSVSIGDYHVRIRRVRQGKGFSNVDADLVQADAVKIAARLIFGVLPDATSPSSHPLTLQPPSPLARRIPFITHPSAAKRTPLGATMNMPIRMAEEPLYYARNAAKARGAHGARAHPGTDSGVVEWAAWCELCGEGERIGQAAIPFFADVFKSLPELLPEAQHSAPGWYATVVMAIEFKAKIPSGDACSPRTVGLYSSGRFLTAGRHDAYAEVWTAPCSIGEGRRSSTASTSPASEDAVPQWREEQICLALSHQMALTIPLENNLERGAVSKQARSRL